jgi:hypothetical protein
LKLLVVDAGDEANAIIGGFRLWPARSTTAKGART